MSPPQQLMQRTSNCSSLLIYQPRKDERLSWPSWLTYSGWFTHIGGHPSATGRAQDSESTPAKDRCYTAGPRNQPGWVFRVNLSDEDTATVGTAPRGRLSSWALAYILVLLFKVLFHVRRPTSCSYSANRSFAVPVSVKFAVKNSDQKTDFTTSCRYQQHNMRRRFELRRNTANANRIRY